MTKKYTKRPLIAVTTDNKYVSPAWLAICFGIWLAGGKAVRVCSKKPKDAESFDAFLISGGSDIDPKLYGAKADPHKSYDIKRDKLESEFIHYALSAQKPLMGICRGYQLINVIKGGDLYTDISEMRKKTKNGIQLFPVKPVTILADTKVSRCLGGLTQTKVNAIHHQAIKSVADSMQAVAYDADEFVQAIESRTPHEAVLGVQWHPEYLFYIASQRGLFTWLVEQAISNRQTDR
ncbi:gamma-glutamyl-gamma-aminobutyrate hydrolase family protein [Gayadomonas joobiniege]|uniref:gamma-glutamyl-gamma-aminobutyrate hydrolase family protein n=1 Tax=Gayadomonas joobiniege TaxID=1234606 RepID=UPI00035CD64B|nr:gamma-glutamyl-gamma-aminobutyrate hydrolase family protein [Gayadomonas joobiniege]